MEFQLVQKIIHKRTEREVDLGFLSEFTMIETMDLSGPKVIMRLRDPYLYLTDTLALRAEDEFDITMADIFARDGIDVVLPFSLLKAPDAASMVVLNMMSTPIYKTKMPRKRSRLFPVGDPSAILGELFQGLKQEITRTPIAEAYHLLAGERDTYALRQLAREQGGHIFLDRDTMRLVRLEELIEKEPEFTYFHNDNREENQVISYQVRDPKLMLKDKVRRYFCGWDVVKGWVESNRNGSAVPERYGSPVGPVLDGINSAPVPVIDCVCTGNGLIRAGSIMGVTWKTRRAEAPLHENLPEKFIVWSVSHYFSDGKYWCRIKGVLPMEDFDD